MDEDEDEDDDKEDEEEASGVKHGGAHLTQLGGVQMDERCTSHGRWVQA